MGRGMIPGLMWKMLCNDLFITYLQHFKTRADTGLIWVLHYKSISALISAPISDRGLIFAMQAKSYQTCKIVHITTKYVINIISLVGLKINNLTLQNPPRLRINWSSPYISINPSKKIFTLELCALVKMVLSFPPIDKLSGFRS